MTDPIFNPAIENLIVTCGGLVAGNKGALRAEFEKYLAPWTALISLGPSLNLPDSFLSKEEYFKICESEEKTKVATANACCSLAVFSFELLKNHQLFPTVCTNSLVEFLRHLRNAGGHGNSFNFRYRGNLIDPGWVEYKDKVITRDLQDTRAFPNFFSLGDFYYLLEDISNLLRQNYTS